MVACWWRHVLWVPRQLWDAKELRIWNLSPGNYRTSNVTRLYPFQFSIRNTTTPCLVSWTFRFRSCWILDARKWNCAHKTRRHYLGNKALYIVYGKRCISLETQYLTVFIPGQRKLATYNIWQNMWMYKSESRENWGHDVPELRSKISQCSLWVKEIRNMLFCSKYSDKKKKKNIQGFTVQFLRNERHRITNSNLTHSLIGTSRRLTHSFWPEVMNFKHAKPQMKIINSLQKILQIEMIPHNFPSF